jgi:hypothetical protein
LVPEVKNTAFPPITSAWDTTVSAGRSSTRTVPDRVPSVRQSDTGSPASADAKNTSARFTGTRVIGTSLHASKIGMSGDAW